MRLGRDVINLDLYAVLRVSPAASEPEIRRAYRRQVHASHPDLNPLDEGAAARMARLNLAAQVLLDHERRSRYDRARGIEAFVAGAGGGSGSRSDSNMEWEPAPKPRRVRIPRELRDFVRTLRHLPGRSAEHVTTELSGWTPQRHAAVLVVALLLTVGLIAHAKPASLSFWCSPDCPPQPVSASKL